MIIIDPEHRARINRLSVFLVGLSPVQAYILLEALESTATALLEFYNYHEENNDNDRNYDRTPATPRQSNAPAAPRSSPADCKTSASITYECGRISGQYTLSTDDPEAAPRISPAD